ncbi:MAG: hypothetical protein IPK02_12475 [Candidatus Accumulibacter sp.]|uniref:Uncharacterized protein n=1 Tax=Candidatus Accumulibacter affinis TaxID=2954384 RepID=A0A935TB17_9PROT|nr:hypothetical protein [Candidatus Accumulibacter affinis]
MNTYQGRPVRGAITATYIPPYIRTIYGAPTGQASLSEAAALLGFDHFNWLQLVNTPHPPTDIHGVQLSNVFYDPPPGGYPTPPIWADNFVYYWNEAIPSPVPANYRSGTYVGDNSTIDTLSFEDLPSLQYRPGEYTQFTTHLVGVKSGNKYSVLSTFSWKSNYYKGDGSGAVFSALVDSMIDYPDSSGGVFDVQENIPLESLPETYREFLVGLGADNIRLSESVPEPAVASLFLVGGFSLVYFRRRTMVRRHALAAKITPETDCLT